MAYTPTGLYQGQPGVTETTATPGILSSAVPASTIWIVKQIVVCNTSTSTAVTLSLSIVPTGSIGGNANRIISNYPLAAGQTTTFDLSVVMTTGGFITAMSSSPNTVTVTISGVVIT